MKTLFVVLILLVCSFAHAEWIEFEKIDQGYYDPDTGKDLISIEGRRNRPGIDAFRHKGTLYPDIGKIENDCKVIKRYEKGNVLIIETDIPQVEIDTIISGGEFKAKILTQEDAELIFTTSGVTQ